MQIKYGLMEVPFGGKEPQKCADDKCIRYIKPVEECMIDVANSNVYCPECGVCERYARKKAEQCKRQGREDWAKRNATIPLD